MQCLALSQHNRGAIGLLRNSSLLPYPANLHLAISSFNPDPSKFHLSVRMSLTPQKAPHMHRPKPFDRCETLRVIFDLPAVRIIHQALAQTLNSELLQFESSSVFLQTDLTASGPLAQKFFSTSALVVSRSSDDRR